MPRCFCCGRIQSSAELKRLPSGRRRCKDVKACERRQAEAERQLALFEELDTA
jgi:hypothetical protein